MAGYAYFKWDIFVAILCHFQNVYTHMLVHTSIVETVKKEKLEFEHPFFIYHLIISKQKDPLKLILIASLLPAFHVNHVVIQVSLIEHCLWALVPSMAMTFVALSDEIRSPQFIVQSLASEHFHQVHIQC